MKLTAQQENAMRRIEDFLSKESDQIFILRGYAGTGKTTLVGCIIKMLCEQGRRIPICMAPTGRAARAMREKVADCEATTIHHRIYDFEEIETDEKEGILHYSFGVKKNDDYCICIVDEASLVGSSEQKHEMFQFGTGVLIEDLLTYARPLHGGKIIFIGDPAQLPPVGDNRSVALDRMFFKEKGLNVEEYTLTDIVRQNKESCVLTDATMLRRLICNGERNKLVFKRRINEVEDIDASSVANAYCNDNSESAAIICFSNKQATSYNKAIRNILFPAKRDVSVGDKLMVVSNNYFMGNVLLNGDIVTVVQVSNDVITQGAPVMTEEAGKRKRQEVSLTFRKIGIRTTDGVIMERYIIDSLLNSNLPNLDINEVKALYINFVMRMRDAVKRYDKNDKSMEVKVARRRTNPRTAEFINAMKEDVFFNALHVKYAYAFTCHKAQGGEWNTVYVDFERRNGLDNDSLRWKYTAVTRAKKRLLCANLVDITPMMDLVMRDIGVASKYSSEALSFGNVAETPFHNAKAITAVKCKYWSVVQNMEGSGYRVEDVKPSNYRDIYSVKTPTGEVVRVDAIYNGAGIFTQYKVGNNDGELLRIFNDESNMVYDIGHALTLQSWKATLHARIISLCDEIGIVLTNVVEKQWQLVYYMKASGRYASLTFVFNKQGFINYGLPLSDIGQKDTKLRQLIDRLKQ